MSCHALLLSALLACAGSAAASPPVRIGYFLGGRTNMVYRAHIHGFFDREEVALSLLTRFLHSERIFEVPKSHRELRRLSRKHRSLSPLLQGWGFRWNALQGIFGIRREDLPQS